MSVANNDGKMSGNAKNTYICFIDYTKAFDRVKYDMLFEILSKAGVPDKEINIIKSIYLQQKATVRYENETSEEITIKRGVRQGCILSPCLFNIHGILDKRSTGGWRGNKHQWTKYHKHQICRCHNHTGIRNQESGKLYWAQWPVTLNIHSTECM